MGENLRKIRKARGLTMKQLAELVDVTESAIGQYETGKRSPSYKVLMRICEALRCQVEDITGVRLMEESLEDPYEDAWLFLEDEIKLLVDRPEVLAMVRASKNRSEKQIECVTALLNVMGEDGHD